MPLFDQPPYHQSVEDEDGKINEWWLNWFKKVASRFASNQSPVGVTVGASPFVLQNTTQWDEDIIVQGGTVSKVEYSRDGTTYYDVGVVAGMFRLSPSDFLRVTYTVAPTMTTIIR